MTTSIYLGLGSNQNAEAHLTMAYRELTLLVGPLVASPVYRNPPIGCDGADFLNMVVGASTSLDPQSLLDAFERIHRMAGRERRGPGQSVWTLDIDLLMYGDVVSQQWKLPRRDLIECAFAAKPMADIAPDVTHPVTGERMADIWSRMSQKADALVPVEIAFTRPEPSAAVIL
ncbi:MAG: 2-amino-4-hydroxy-6-hydroxymethyldihydropteridine diphosphokinase [Pseudomonadota bacterium]